MIRTAQFRLQRIQKSPNGWQLANRLLESSSANCQFFGALTFTVKLNGIDTENPDVNPEEIISQLAQWLAVVKSRQFKPFVVNKLLSTLSTFFCKFPQFWNDSILSVIAIIATGQPIIKPISRDDNSSSISESSIDSLILQLSADDLFLALKFCQTLIDDLRSTYLPDAKGIRLESILFHNMLYFGRLIMVVLDSQLDDKIIIGDNINDNNNNTNDNDNSNKINNHKLNLGNNTSELIVLALETTAAWINHFSKTHDAEKDLKVFLMYFIYYLESPFDEHVFLTTIELVTDVFKYDKKSIIWQHRTARDRLYQFILKMGSVVTYEIQHEDIVDERSTVFCRLLIAFTEHIVPSYLLDPSSSPREFTDLLEYILAFSNIGGIPIVDDALAMEVLEFWNDFVEEIVGGGTLSSDQPQTNYVTRVIDIYWNRIKLPGENITQSWPKDAWQEFMSFRQDFCDFLELAYPLVSTTLFELLINSVMRNLSQQQNQEDPQQRQHERQLHLDNMNWQEIECSLYCLNGLSDMIGTSGDEYNAVKSIFSSSLWEDLSSCQSLRVRQTAVSLIGSFDSFFERPEGQQYLPATLSYLFKSLEIPSLSLTASRSIQKLCSSCRNHLTPLLPSFLDLYVSMRIYDTVGTTANERSVNAISCVIQALKNIEDESLYIDRIISIIIEQLDLIVTQVGNNRDDSTINAADTSSSNSIDPPMLERTISLLKCIVNVGRGLRTPEEHNNIPPEQLVEIANYWNTFGTIIQEKILRVLQVFTIDCIPFSKNQEICEVCCDILKCGFSEVVYNPFVFPTDTILTFITAKYKLGPPTCYSNLVDLASCLVTSSSVGNLSLASNYIFALLETFFSQTVISVEYESDVQVGNLQLLTQIWSHYPEAFLSTPALDLMIGFASQMLHSSDRFVLRAASKFWSTFIVKDGDFKDENLKIRRMESFESVGPSLVETLALKVSGDAARSDLEYYSDVIKKLIAKYPIVTKPWFIRSLVELPQGNLARRDLTLRNQFVTRIFNLRGARETNSAVKNFWSACRGITDYA